MSRTICVLAKESPSQYSPTHFATDADILVQVTMFFGARVVCFASGLASFGAGMALFGAGMAAFGAGVALFGAGAFFVPTPAPLHSVECHFPAQVPYLKSHLRHMQPHLRQTPLDLRQKRSYLRQTPLDLRQTPLDLRQKRSYLRHPAPSACAPPRKTHSTPDVFILLGRGCSGRGRRRGRGKGCRRR